MAQDVLDPTALVDAWNSSRPATDVDMLTSAWRSQQPLGFVDAMRDVVERPAKLVPFLSGASEALEMKRLYDAAVALERGAASDEQRGLVIDFLEQSERPRGVGYIAGSILTELPAFAGEFAATSGALPAGRKIAQEAVGGVIKQAVTKAAKGVGKSALQLGLMEAGSQAVGALALGQGGSRIEAETWRRALPDMHLDADEAGKLDVVLSGTSRDFYDALPAGIASQLIEVVSERSGGALGRLVGLDRIKLAQGAVARWFLGKGGDVDSLAARVAEKGGWNGVVNEYLEERFGGALRAGTLVGEREFGDVREVFPELEQQAAELLAFSVPGVAGSLVDAGRPAGVMPRDADAPLPTIPPSGTVAAPPREIATPAPDQALAPAQLPTGGAAAGAPTEQPSAPPAAPALESERALPAGEAGQLPITTEPPAAPPVPDVAPDSVTNQQSAQAEEQTAAPQSEGSPLEPQAPSTTTQAAPAPPEPPAPPTQATASQEPTEATGVKNATVERELAAMGLPPPEHGESVPDLERHGRAMEKLRADPFAGARLVEELAGARRPPTADEGALLALEVNRLINEREAAQGAFNADPSEANEARVEKAIADYSRAADVVTIAGTESAQSLRIRRMMVARDYSLAAVERRMQVARGGEELTPEQRARYAEITAKIRELEQKLDEKIGELELRAATAEAERNVTQRRESRRTNRQKKIQEAQRRIEEGWQRFHAQRQGLHAGGVTSQDLATLAQIAADYVQAGYHSAAQFVDDAVAKLGEEFRKPAEEAWAKAENEPRLKKYKTRKHREIAERMRQLETGERPTKRPPVEYDEEAIKLKAESERLKQRLRTEEAREKRKRRTRTQKTVDAVREMLVDLPKAVKTSWDWSAVFRQGAFFGLGHPVQTARHIRRMIGATLPGGIGEQRALEIDVQIRNRPLASFGEASGLELTALDETLTAQEEAIRSRFSDKIPGLKASNRAYVTFLNMQRAAMFDRMVSGLPEVSLDAGRAIANAVNVGTGRGNPGRYKQQMEVLGLALWAPRLYLSRIQLILGQPLLRGNMDTRKAIAKEYARFLIGLSGVYALAKFAGEWMDDDDKPTIETDTDSSDFGKIKIGETRIDPLAGLAQFTVFGSRVGGATVDALMGRPAEKNIFKKTDTVIWRMLRTKFTPTLGAIVDVASRENVVGEEVTPLSAAIGLGTPLSFSSILEAMEDQGVSRGAALGVLSIFGFGLQTYGPETKKRNKQGRNVLERTADLFTPAPQGVAAGDR